MQISLNEQLKQIEDLLRSGNPQDVETAEQILTELEQSNQADESEESLTDLERRRLKTEESQEIGPLPEIKDPARRASCKFDLRKFIFTYHRSSLINDRGEFMGLSPYQEELVEAFQNVIVNGGKDCRSVRRGGLKSTLARLATEWSILYGHRKFVVLVGASDDKSEEHRDNLLDLIKTAPELVADFPELKPLLMKKSNPKKQLRLDGKLLNCTAKDPRGCILFAEIDGAESSGSRVAPYSIASTDVSGLAFVDETGRTVRPDLLIFDDVQTPQSAKSFMQTGKRENSISTTFMGLAGLGATIAAIMVCTVREQDDLTLRFLDRKRHPDWNGKAYAVLLKEPKDKQKWAIYAQKLREGDTAKEGFDLATAYYVENRAAMDEGGIVAWDKDKEVGYVSALQWCMTIQSLQPEFFRCELQQQGAAPAGDIVQLSATTLVKRLSRIPRGVVPSQASYLTAFVDSSDHVLWWMVCAWGSDFSGWIVDYGTWPDQKRAVFYKSDLQRKLEDELPGSSWEECFVNAHNKLEEFLLGREWNVGDSDGITGTKSVDLMLKDWSDGDHEKRIASQLRASNYRSRIRPSKGAAPKPGRKPVSKWGDARYDRSGPGWVERRIEKPMHVQYDTNIWKSHASRRLKTVVGAPSSLVLPGDDEEVLGLLAEHLTAEIAKQFTYDGTPGTIWELIPGRNNDWWDCLVGNMVAASMLGVAIPGEQVAKTIRKRRTRSATYL